MADRPLRTRAGFSSLFGQPHIHYELLQDIRDATLPGYAADRVYTITGSGVTVFTPAPGDIMMGIRVEFESFLLRSGDWLKRDVDSVVFGADTLTISGHEFDAGWGPFTMHSSLTLPGGTTSGTLYFAELVDGDTFKLHTSRVSAENSGSDLVTLTSNGTGDVALNGSGPGGLHDFPPDGVATELVEGHHPLLLDAGDGKGNSPITPVFAACRARPFTVSGASANSRMKVSSI